MSRKLDSFYSDAVGILAAGMTFEDEGNVGLQLGTVLPTKADMAAGTAWHRGELALAHKLAANPAALGLDGYQAEPIFDGVKLTGPDGRFTEITAGNAQRIEREGRAGLRWYCLRGGDVFAC